MIVSIIPIVFVRAITKTNGCVKMDDMQSSPPSSVFCYWYQCIVLHEWISILGILVEFLHNYEKTISQNNRTQNYNFLE